MKHYKYSRKMLASIVGHYDNLEDFAFDLLATNPSKASSKEDEERNKWKSRCRTRWQTIY